MRIFFCFFLLAFTLTAFAQKQVTVKFVPAFGESAIVLDEVYYHLPGGDSVVFETFRCYISGIAFYNRGVEVFEEKDSYHLIDASATGTIQVTIPLSAPINYDEVRFNLGIDSITNVSGAMGGDLDPTKGMYWAWQSGYINLKLEGRSNLCKTRKNGFEFHLGGYSNETKALAEVRLKVPSSGPITIKILIDKFLQDIDLATNNSIMIPCSEAVVLAKKMAQLFEVEKQ